jgi:hypothetical protein
MNPADALRAIRKTLDGNPDAAALRAIRTSLKQPGFLEELIEHVRKINDPNGKAELLSDLVAISDHCSDQAASRKADGTSLRYGIGAGLGLAATGMLGIAAAPVMIILVFAGGWVAFKCGEAAKRLGTEEQIYQDLTTRVTKMLEKFDVSGT